MYTAVAACVQARELKCDQLNTTFCDDTFSLIESCTANWTQDYSTQTDLHNLDYSTPPSDPELWGKNLATLATVLGAGRGGGKDRIDWALLRQNVISLRARSLTHCGADSDQSTSFDWGMGVPAMSARALTGGAFLPPWSQSLGDPQLPGGVRLPLPSAGPRRCLYHPSMTVTVFRGGRARTSH